MKAELGAVGVRERREDMLKTLERANKNGMEIKELIKIYAYKWNVHVQTVKKYISDFIELQKARIEGSRIYHSMFLLPSER